MTVVWYFSLPDCFINNEPFLLKMGDNTLFNRSSIKPSPGPGFVSGCECDVINFDYPCTVRDIKREREWEWVCDIKVNATYVSGSYIKQKIFLIPLSFHHIIKCGAFPLELLTLFSPCNVYSSTTIPFSNVKWKCETNRRHVCWCEIKDETKEGELYTSTVVDCVWIIWDKNKSTQQHPHQTK